MYAVISTGGKQYRVQAGDIVQVEKLEGEVGVAVTFDKVLLCGKPSAESSQIWLGKPLLSGATVQAEVVGQGRGEKILIVKMKRRKQYRRTQGHRQNYTQLLVTGVANGAGETVNLSDTDKKATLGKFQSHLKDKGLAFTPKTLGSRKRLAAAAQVAAGHKPTGQTAGSRTASTTEKAAPAPKAKKAAAPKTAAAKKTK
jgi:large subunit ribosomal protein L21